MSRKNRGRDRREVERRADDRLPPPQNQFVARVQGAVFQGPLPPPEILAKYNEALPGAAERIIAMAEKNQDHRQKLEAIVIPSRARNERRGQIIGAIVALSAIGCGTYLIAINKDVQGLAVILSDVVALVGTFLYVDIRKRKE